MNKSNLIEEYHKFIQEVAGLLGLDSLIPDEDGLISLCVDSHELHLQLIPATSRLLIFTHVTTLSRTADAEIYKKLLGANLFCQETGGGWFGLEDLSDDVVYHYLIDFLPVPPDPRDFITILEQIVELAEDWKESLLS